MNSATEENEIRTETRRFSRARHEEWLIDEAIRDSFPASDPASTSQPGSLASERYAKRVTAQEPLPG